jgi:hypothetical protein
MCVKIVQEAVADGDYSEGQGKAIVERVRALSKESAGVTSTHDNASNSDATFAAADSAAPASTTADSGKKRFSIFGGGKKTPPPPPPPPPPKSELGLSVQDLEAKFKAAAGSDEVLNKAEFNALVLSLMKGASQRPSERDLDAAFEISDADKSGTVYKITLLNFQIYLLLLFPYFLLSFMILYFCAAFCLISDYVQWSFLSFFSLHFGHTITCLCPVFPCLLVCRPGGHV